MPSDSSAAIRLVALITCDIIARLCSPYVAAASLRAVGGIGVQDGATTFDHYRELRIQRGCLSRISIWMSASDGILAFGASYGAGSKQLEASRVTTSAYWSVYGNNSDPSPSLSILLQSGEYIHSMQGWYGLSGAQVTINYISFTVQLLNGSTAVFGAGEQSDWQDVVEGPVFGFWGSHNMHITHIGVYVDQTLWSEGRLSILKFPKYGTIRSTSDRSFDTYDSIQQESATIDFLSVYHSADFISGFFVNVYFPDDGSSSLRLYGRIAAMFGDILLNVSAGDFIAGMDLGFSGSCIVGMNVEVMRGHSQTNEIHRFGGSVESAENNVSFPDPIHGFHGFYDSCISALGVYSILQEQGTCSGNDTHCPAGVCGIESEDGQANDTHTHQSDTVPASAVWPLVVGCVVASLVLMVILPVLGAIVVYWRNRQTLVFPEHTMT